MKKVAALFRKNAVWIGLAFLILLFVQIYSRALIEREDGLYATHTNVWADWSLHVSMTNLFAFEPVHEWFRHHPVWSGGGFTYPFLTNLIPALFMRLGFSISTAMNGTALVYALLFLWGAFRLGIQLTGSRSVSITALFIFIFSSGHGGLGFWFSKVGELFSGDWSWGKFLTLPPDPSRIEASSWLAGNALEATIFPQRAMLLGMAIGVWALALWFRGKARGVGGAKDWVFSGLLIGLLPIAHMHTLIAFVIVLPFLFYPLVRVRDFRFVKLYLPGAILAGVLYFLFVHGKIENKTFIGFLPFWTAHGPIDWISLWWSLWGIFLPYAIFTEYTRVRTLGLKNAFSHDRFLFALGFFTLFIVANFILFQPMHWDNSKLFFWSYFGLSFSVASLLKVLWESEQAWVRSLAVLSGFVLVSSGSVEVLRIVHYGPETYRMTERPAMELGVKIRHQLHPREIFLTAPAHNHFISMWATQPLFMGYAAWAMNYGFPWSDREAELKVLLGGHMDLEVFLEQTRTHRIRFVCIGPDEMRYLPDLNEQFFSRHFKVAFEDGPVRIYDLKDMLQIANAGKTR